MPLNVITQAVPGDQQGHKVKNSNSAWCTLWKPQDVNKKDKLQEHVHNIIKHR